MTMMRRYAIIFAVWFPAAALWVRADDFAARCADRSAIERVYHSHRLGTKQSFEEAMPRALLEQVIRQDQHKEALLRKMYSVEITPAMVTAEVERINSTTRAPEVLAEIKRALGDDPSRFASGIARPNLVERELHRRFESDDKLHAGQRQAAEQARQSLRENKPVKGMQELTWSLTPRPVAAKSGPPAPPTPTQAKSNSTSYSNNATAQVSQALTPSANAESGKEKVFFEDLDPELQKVLQAQLQKAGDISAVIETPGCFFVYMVRKRDAEVLEVAAVSLPKISYDEWLAAQKNPTP